MKTYAIVAQEMEPLPEGARQTPAYVMWVMLLGIFAVFYLIVLRPQRRRERERQRKREEMIGALKKSDHVMTIGGMHGVVSSLSDDTVVLKVDEKNDVRVHVSRDAISKVVGLEDEQETERERRR